MDAGIRVKIISENAEVLCSLTRRQSMKRILSLYGRLIIYQHDAMTSQMAWSVGIVKRAQAASVKGKMENPPAAFWSGEADSTKHCAACVPYQVTGH